MKDDLQNKLVEILSAIQTTAGKAGDFALTQLPDVAQSYVTYGRAVSSLGVAIGFLLWITSAICLRRSVLTDDEEFAKAWFVSLVFTAIAGGMFIAINANSALLVWLAPKVWLLKEIANLLK